MDDTAGKHQAGVGLGAKIGIVVALLVVVAAAAREVTPGPAQEMPTLVNMSDDPFRITDGNGQVVAALNLSTHSTRTTRNEMRERFLPALRETAALVSATIA